MTVSLPATVAPDAMYAPCVALVADVLTLYVYAVDDVLQITMDETTVYVLAVLPLSHTFVAEVAVVVPSRLMTSAMSGSHQEERLGDTTAQNALGPGRVDLDHAAVRLRVQARGARSRRAGRGHLRQLQRQRRRLNLHPQLSSLCQHWVNRLPKALSHAG